jgi:hypothetical protein
MESPSALGERLNGQRSATYLCLPASKPESAALSPSLRIESLEQKRSDYPPEDRGLIVEIRHLPGLHRLFAFFRASE